MVYFPLTSFENLVLFCLYLCGGYLKAVLFFHHPCANFNAILLVWENEKEFIEDFPLARLSVFRMSFLDLEYLYEGKSVNLVDFSSSCFYDSDFIWSRDAYIHID